LTIQFLSFLSVEKDILGKTILILDFFRLPLDREKEGEHTLVVEATDQVHPIHLYTKLDSFDTGPPLKCCTASALNLTLST